MDKRILITTLSVVGVLSLVTLFGTDSFGNLGSMAVRTRVMMQRPDSGYVSCQKYEYKTENERIFGVYLSSSKKTYATTTDTGKTIDVSALVNAEYFRQQTITYGQSDTGRIKYDIIYTNNNVTLVNKILMGGQEYKCPNILLPISNMPDDGALAASTPTCKEIVSELTVEERQGVTCTGEYSLSVEKTLPQTQLSVKQNPTISLLANLLMPSVYATLLPSTTYPEPSTTYSESSTTDYGSSTTYSAPSTTNRKIRCENGVNINDYMNCRCKYGTREYEDGEYIVRACKAGKEETKEAVKKVLKIGPLRMPSAITEDERGREIPPEANLKNVISPEVGFGVSWTWGN